MTNAEGLVTDSYEYDAFGNSFTKVGTTPNNYLYRGEQYDSDLGLYYLRARYYNPATGRFLSRDPDDHSLKNPNDLHKYLYANGDPVNGWDPTGRGDDLVEYSFLSKRAVLAAVVLVACTDFIVDLFEFSPYPSSLPPSKQYYLDMFHVLAAATACLYGVIELGI